MRVHTKLKLFITYIAVGIPNILTHPVFADTAGVSDIQSFLKNVILVLTGIAGFIATGFFVVGGLHYIMSSGNPEHMDRAKRTITYSALGLAITIAAFILSNIVTSLATSAFGS